MKILLFLSLLLPITPAFAEKYSDGNRTFNLEKNEGGYWITSKCAKTCTAARITQDLHKEDIETLLKAHDNARLPVSSRICEGLGGKLWVLSDSHKHEHSVCEFNDKSAIRNDGLTLIYNRYFSQK